MPRRRFVLLLESSLLATTLLSGCAGRHHLASYDFSSRSLAVVYDLPPYPEVLTGPYVPGHFDDPIHAIVSAGSRIAKEVQARQVRRRLDSAATLVNVASLVADEAGVRAARYLGCRLIPEEERPDFRFEIRIRDYGIDAEDWDAAARFFVAAEVHLLDGRDGRLIWKTKVREKEPVSPELFGWPVAARNVVTAAALADLSVEELTRALEQLADYAADRVTRRLRDALEDSR
jgi:hypothetical protein